EEKGFTYKTSDGIYFDSSKFKDYGILGRLNESGLKAGKRVDLGEKKSKTDFALWKFSPENEKRQQEWKSPFGIGFPGWHIECSAMSSKYLGKEFDIHTGGIDHVQVHHTNEIAQSECALGVKPWVRYWLHGEFLTFKGEKVSKSTGGLYTISDLEKLGFDAIDFRYLCLNTHYRKQLNFDLKVLEGAKNAHERLKNILLELKRRNNSNNMSLDEYKKEFLGFVNDDLNMPEALSVLWNVLRDEKLGSKEKLELVYEFDKVLGLNLKSVEEEKVPEEIQKLVAEREQARKDKDFKKADGIRKDLKNKGYLLEDSKEGILVKKN
ncbi:cysteine--tRNA ligase, partial [Candidatus Woesearchaeota archaeon]|nr:cysteine--tRNA ligase [Candidatus Woesearchaeota archaeon]